MKMDVTIRSYDVKINASPEQITSTVLAAALGSSVSLVGIHEAKVLTSTISFVLTQGAYDLSSATQSALTLINDVNVWYEAFKAESAAKLEEFDAQSSAAIEDVANAAADARTATAGAEKVNATLSGTMLTVVDRNGNSTTVNTKGEQGAQGEPGQDADIEGCNTAIANAQSATAAANTAAQLAQAVTVGVQESINAMIADTQAVLDDLVERQKNYKPTIILNPSKWAQIEKSPTLLAAFKQRYHDYILGIREEDIADGDGQHAVWKNAWIECTASDYNGWVEVRNSKYENGYIAI